jgi:predicted kinase
VVPLPKLLIFCGIPGTGKSTIAKLVGARLEGTVHIQTDAVRSMISNPTYTNEESEFVYSVCTTMAREALQRGYNAILDGTFLREEYREDALRLLGSAYDSYLVVFVHCDVMTAYARNASRKATVPQARFNQMMLRMEEPAGALKIDSGKTSAELAAEAVLEQIRGIR